MLLFWTWWALLAVFRAFPGIDIYFSQLFFVATDCGATAAAGSICGGFPYRDVATFDLLGFLRDTGKYFTVNYMLQKESVNRRLESEEGAGTRVCLLLPSAPEGSAGETARAGPDAAAPVRAVGVSPLVAASSSLAARSGSPITPRASPE